MTAQEGGRLTDDHRRQLDELERVKKPSDWQRGELSALRIFALRADDRRRVAALTEQWSKR